MNKFAFKIIKAITLFAVLISCKPQEQKTTAPLQIAFLSDVHLLDIYGQFSDTDYRGVINPGTGKYTLLRTMQSQLESTRLFNENYFAFKAALNDVVAKGIKYVVLPGDFSDDGQLLNIRGLKKILRSYEQQHQIQFILTTGNHDPVRPFFQHAGKKDFWGVGGRAQPIFSKEGLNDKPKSHQLPTIITKDIAKSGYEGIFEELKSFGFQPRKNTLYWETPFTKYTYNAYDYEQAIAKSDIKHRTYKIKPSNAEVPDLSYLIEPVDGLWFLAIDGNVYVPKGKELSYNPKDFEGASVGYNEVLTHKNYLLNWIKSVTERATKLGKHLVVFSHYPTVDFNDDATTEMKALFGENNMQMHRVPREEVARALAEAGVKVHFGGHMHINDTGVRRFENNSLVNVQVPSLAAYIPAYKLLTIKKGNKFDIQTIVLDSVPDFKELFPLYEEEHRYLKRLKTENIWNDAILKSSTYKEFTANHLKELVRLRFLKEDWPLEVKNMLIGLSGTDLMTLAKENGGDIATFQQQLNLHQIAIDDYKLWTGLNMIHDFYKFKNADMLAVLDVGKTRLKQYLLLAELFKSSKHEKLALWGTIFLKFCNGQPANHFEIDLQLSTITAINPLY